ncbi:hypothetical protein [Desulfovibrio sp. SGI.169]|uniref:hypothetical protein n=1 Tax=Desulfovibrio sp. SGI.169 TaxID=3420561 RepID=UPI003D075FBE
MSKFRNICWWVFFMVTAICLQALAPGLDVLAAGVILLLQERDYKNMLWLLPLFVLLQEGMGSRVFGGVIVWYATIIVLFKLGRWLFEVENFIFIFLLSSCLGAACYGVAWLMAPLQDLPFDARDTLDKSLLQALFLPFAWRLLIATRHWIRDDEEK